MALFQPGNPGKPKGCVHKDKRLVREIVEEALGGMSIPARLIQLAKQNPQREAEILENLMPYCYPKIQMIEIARADDRYDAPPNLTIVAEIKKQLQAKIEGLPPPDEGKPPHEPAG